MYFNYSDDKPVEVLMKSIAVIVGAVLLGLLHACGGGHNAVENKEFEKAISFYMRAIKLNPDLTEAYNNMGVAYGNQGNHTKAIRLFKKAARLGLPEAPEHIQTDRARLVI